MTGGWGGGYPTALTYMASLQPETAPGALALVALAQQREPPRFDRPFRYAEMGCGRGLTLLAHAACHPQGRFYGADYMPEHVTFARRLAEEAELDNLRVDEADFATLAGQDAPDGPVEALVCHGVWSWVSAANRAALVRIAARWIAPGGLCLVSYNARPHWNALDPLRRIVREMMGPHPERADFERLRQAVEDWLDLAGNDTMRAFWRKVAAQSDRYLIHDLGADHAEAFWPSDVADQLAEARLLPLGQSALETHVASLRTALARALEAAGQAAGYSRAASDMAQAVPFRSDVLARGAPSLSPAGVLAALSRWLLRPAAPEPGRAADTVALTPDAETALAALTARLPMEVGAAVDGIDLAPAKALQLLLLAMATGRLRLMPPLDPRAQGAIRRVNALSARRARLDTPLPLALCAESGTILRISAADAAHLWDGAGHPDPDRAAWLSGFDCAPG